MEKDYIFALREFARMCKSNRNSNGSCKSDCPLQKSQLKSKNGSCWYGMLNYPEIAGQTVEKWAANNPRKSYLERYKEFFLKARFSDGIPTVCCGDVFGFDCKYKDLSGNACTRCWNQEME